MAQKDKGKSQKYVLIGLGGTGTEIVDQIYAQVSEDMREDVVIHGFDTNKNDIDDRENMGGHITQTSVPLRPDEYIERLEKYKIDDERTLADEVRDWFPNDPVILKRQSMENGAGQVRSTSRLAFRSALMSEKKMQVFENDIKSLGSISSDKEVKGFEVVIVSSLAGGTGSGLFIQIAFYLKNFIKEQFGEEPRVKGFFLLPDIFTNTVLSASQHDGVRSNTYAAIKELDNITEASMYSKQKNRRPIELEYRPGQLDEYGRPDHIIDTEGEYPYDLVFLYDYLNSKGEYLAARDIEPYKQQVAATVYQTVFTSLSKKISGAENNLIDKLRENDSRNYYCGAGVGRLIYPYERIIEYLATKWAREKTKNEWLKIDEQYKEELEEFEKNRHKNPNAVRPDKSERFLEIFEREVKNSRAFGLIEDMLLEEQEKEGSRNSIKKSYAFTHEVEKRINDFVDEELKKKIDDITGENGIINNLSDVEDDDLGYVFEELYDKLSKLKKRADSFTGKNKNYLHKEIIFPENDESITYSSKKYNINSYIVEDNNKAMHPIAVRHFLIEVKKELNRLKLNSEEIKRNAENSLEIQEIFKTGKFEPSENDNVHQDAADYATSRKFFIFSHRDKVIEEIKTNTEVMLGVNIGPYQKDSGIIGYIKASLQAAVYERVSSDIEQFIRQWEDFFANFKPVERELAEKVEELEEEHNDIEDETTVYMLGSRYHKRKLWEGLKDNSSLDQEMPVDIFLSIYEGMYAHFINTIQTIGRNEEQVDVKRIFSENVIGFNTIELKNMRMLNKNIFEALKEHCRMDLEREGNAADGEAIAEEMREYIDKLNNATTDWIRVSANREASNHYWGCTKDSEDIRKYISEDKSNVVMDDTFSMYELVRMKGYYGFMANEIIEFSYSEDNNDKGSYFAAYAREMRALEEEEEVGEITPHLDKRWNYVGMMHDINPEYDKLKRKEIRRAFLYGLLFDKFYKEDFTGEDLNKKEVWHYGRDPLKPVEKTIVTDLYSVFDSLFFLPNVVYEILSEAERKIKAKSLGEREKIDKHEFINGLYNTGNSGDIPFDVVLEIILDDFAKNGEEGDEDLKPLLNDLLEIISEYIEEVEDKPRTEADHVVKTEYLPKLKEQSRIWKKDIEQEPRKLNIFEDSREGVLDPKWRSE